MENVFDVLVERGFIKQCTDEAALRTILNTSLVTSYIGYDPTAKSLTVGHLLPMRETISLIIKKLESSVMV